MKAKVAALWIEALESGKYRQVDGHLKAPKGKKGYGHCCLGVLCDLYSKETGKGEWEGGKGSKTFICSKGKIDHFGDLQDRDSSETELPEAVRKWAGMKTDCGELPTAIVVESEDVTRSYKNLVLLNDDAKYNFKQIAKVIKQNSKSL